MEHGRMKLNTARFKSDPRVAIDIAYRVCERYYELGCPETDSFNREQDGWYTEGALSGGKVEYAVKGLGDGADPVYEHTEAGVLDALRDGAEAGLRIQWGRCNLQGPGFLKVSVNYPERWSSVKAGMSVFASSFGRRFVPAHIISETIPHRPANREQIFGWINEFVDRPREATAAPGVEFFAGAGAIKQIKSEILNILISEDGADVISPEYISGRFDLSIEYSYDILEELYHEKKIKSLEVPKRYSEATVLYGSAAEWSNSDVIEKDDDLLVRYRP